MSTMGMDEDRHDEQTPASPPAQQGDQLRPYCRVHYCLMRASGSDKKVTRYSCSVPGCNETAKRARPRAVIPGGPHACPICRNAGKRKPVYCEVVPAPHRSGFVRLACPTDGCDYHHEVPRPGPGAPAGDSYGDR